MCLVGLKVLKNKLSEYVRIGATGEVVLAISSRIPNPTEKIGDLPRKKDAAETAEIEPAIVAIINP